MSNTKQIKDYYFILGVTQEASASEIDEAYNHYAVMWHPDKHKQDRHEAQRKFKDICEAYDILSDKSKKANYDELVRNEFTIEEAQKTFEKFYSLNGIVNEQEKAFFTENYPHKIKNFHDILGVNPESSIGEVQDSYRKLVLQHHPLKNQNSEESLKKFIDLNEAFNYILVNHDKKSPKKLSFGTIVIEKAHQIFDNFFTQKLSEIHDQQLKPFIHNKWIKNLDQLMHKPNHYHGQTKRVHQIHSNKNGVETKKIVKQTHTIKDGLPVSIISQEYHFPNGEKEVRHKVKHGDQEERKVYHVKADEELPNINFNHINAQSLLVQTQNQCEKLVVQTEAGTLTEEKQENEVPDQTAIIIEKTESTIAENKDVIVE